MTAQNIAPAQNPDEWRRINENRSLDVVPFKCSLINCLKSTFKTQTKKVKAEQERKKFKAFFGAKTAVFFQTP